MLLQEKENNFLSLKCLMTEENETVHQIECEMQKLLDIISNDQDLIQRKDEQIALLQRNLNCKTETAKESNKLEVQAYYEEMILEKDIELQTMTDEKDYQLFNSRLALEENRRIIRDYEEELETLKHTITQQGELAKTHNVLKTKIGDLMNIIEKQNEQISNFNEKQTSQETISQRNEILQKELHVLKVKIQQKELDIKSLNQLLDSKDEALKELEDFDRKALELKKTLKENFMQELEGKDEQIETMTKRFNEEQENHKQTENELITLKLELENTKAAKTTISQADNNCDKDFLIEELERKLQQEQQISSHLQLVQEREIIEKEKEIEVLKQILSGKNFEANVIVENREEVQKFLKFLNRFFFSIFYFRMNHQIQ